SFVLPAGMTRQIWLTFAPRRRAPGTYRGYVELSADGIEPLRVPIEFRVLPGTCHMRASLHPGGGDDTDTKNALGLTPNNTPAQDNRIVTWARAIKAAQPAVRIWENPTYSDPSAAEAAALDAADVLAIKTWLLIEQGGTFAEFFRRRGALGQELALYGASGPARLTDPYSYQRLQGWMCAAMGAASGFFWSFSDDAGNHSWN